MEAGDIPCPPAGPGGDTTTPARLKPAARPLAPSCSHLLAVGGHEVEAAGGDGQGDGHAGELQVALPQDGVQGAAAGLGAGGSVRNGAPGPGASSPSRGGQLALPTGATRAPGARPSTGGWAEVQPSATGSPSPPAALLAQPHLPPPHGSLGTGHSLTHQADRLPARSAAGCQSGPGGPPLRPPTHPSTGTRRRRGGSALTATSAGWRTRESAQEGRG